MHSLSRRLLISVALPLALFSAVMMLVLDRGFRTLSERSLQELLDAEMVALIAAADPQPGRRLRAGGAGARAAPGDAAVGRIRADPLARARVALALDRRASRATSGRCCRTGERSLTYADFEHDRVAIESRAIQFEEGAAESGAYTFSVAVSLAPYEQQLWRFGASCSAGSAACCWRCW